MTKTRKKALDTPEQPVTNPGTHRDAESTHQEHGAAHLPDPATEFNPADLERQSEQRAHILNPSRTRRESHTEAVTRRQLGLPSKLSISAGDMRVQMIDAGKNEMGIGIRVVFPENRKPTDEEKEIIRHYIKGEDGEHSEFKWDANAAMWHKHIFRHGERPDDVPPSRPVAIRLDAESRVQKLADALREHSADPASYTDRVQQRRVHAAESDRIPD